MSDFWKQYEHPKWQEKRLEVMGRAEFKCEFCKKSNEQLHVHHGYYERGLKPWDYPNESLYCLCKECHGMVGDCMTWLKRSIGCLPLHLINVVRGYVLALDMANRDIENDDRQVFIGQDEAVGVAHFSNATIEQVESKLGSERILTPIALDELYDARVQSAIEYLRESMEV